MPFADPTDTDTAPPGQHGATELAGVPLWELSIDFAQMQMFPSPLGTRLVAVIADGHAHGPDFDATVLAGGGDWIVMGDDGVARLDVRATLLTADGTHVALTGGGRARMTDAARDRFLAGDTIREPDLVGRGAHTFEVAAGPHEWLNSVLAVGLVRELAQDHIRYDVWGLR